MDEARAQLPARISVIAKQDPARLKGVESAEDRGDSEDGWRRWNVRLAPGVRPGDVLERCVAEQFPLRQFEQLHASLHDVFVHLVGSAEASK